MFHKAKCRACVRLTARSLSTANKQATVDLFPAHYGPEYMEISVRLACLKQSVQYSKTWEDAHVPSTGMAGTKAVCSARLWHPEHARCGKWKI